MGVKKTVKTLAIGVTAMVMAASAANAGQTYIDQTGYAVSGYDVVAFFDLKQAEFGQAQPKPVPGNELIFAEHKGATYVFASMENRVRFMNDPERFVPKYDGHCSLAVMAGVKLPGNPNNWRIIDDQLYLTTKNASFTAWEKSPIKHIVEADENWVEIDDDLASRQSVFELDQSLAPYEG